MARPAPLKLPSHICGSLCRKSHIFSWLTLCACTVPQFLPGDYFPSLSPDSCPSCATFPSTTYGCCWVCWHLFNPPCPSSSVTEYTQCQSRPKRLLLWETFVCENSLYYFILFFTYSSPSAKALGRQRRNEVWMRFHSQSHPSTLMSETINLGLSRPDSIPTEKFVSSRFLISTCK